MPARISFGPRRWFSKQRELFASIGDALQAINSLQASLGADARSADIGKAYFQMGRALDARGKKDEARAAFRTAAEQLEKTLGTNHVETRAARELAGLNP
jgi:tetratricopeptide (TPR) repeat protein